MVILVVAGGMSYYMFSSKAVPPSQSTSTTTVGSTVSVHTTEQTTSSSSPAQTSQTLQTSVASSSTTSVRTSTDSTALTTSSTTATTSSFVVPRGGSEVIIPEGIQSPNAEQDNITFAPATLKVVVGVNNTIYFYNADLTDNLGHVIESVAWPTGGQTFAFAVLPGQVANITLTTPGTYKYDCEWHPVWMLGTIVVLG